MKIEEFEAWCNDNPTKAEALNDTHKGLLQATQLILALEKKSAVYEKIITGAARLLEAGNRKKAYELLTLVVNVRVEK